jgi:hypothetical protein
MGASGRRLQGRVAYRKLSDHLDVGQLWKTRESLTEVHTANPSFKKMVTRWRLFGFKQIP